ncbi:FtsW/RodA/SpoVE family cell cycle protein [Varunaivibrio sulfuroxidans]|uniref:Probable peptidoglycan glycosyltransferase FtsW n=1 Tax=Varunaivibrio sulfuroxidans TaxID=1773489 RepID=A0A4R3JAY3_9PROT|nr:putative peptidoglycan glycosyltransferase FtsW [Varunaivibrio sulfuroxidans]TCS62193.1 cell division protein FtsW [Varunaivibrio sulfuroxidans]WES30620.1 putative peptidoglycan glycosyltransferase FtsW [Varunaivibrio sulfuroxidans]
MSTTFARTDTSLIGRWWWTVDRWTLAAVIVIAAIGAVLTMAASPSVAERIGYDAFHFVRRQFVFLPAGMVLMVAVSLLSPRGVRRLAVLMCAVSLILMIAVLLVGVQTKGAARWISIAGLSVQPSEFVKPAFAVLAAWMFAEQRVGNDLPGYALASGLFVVVVGLLLLQPDVGMSIVVGAVWAVEFFLAGLPLVLVGAIALMFLGGGVGAYFVFDHVRIRVDRFFDPALGGGYQVTKALDAFSNGGLFGRGPGEGRVKELLPDAHTDFILAVAGEEFGLLLCLLIVGLFAFIVLRGFSKVFKGNDLFSLLAVSGLLVQFGLQAIINIASTTNLMPPKGMTLPFVSYGGSSTIALALTMGMVLALTRESPGAGGPR